MKKHFPVPELQEKKKGKSKASIQKVAVRDEILKELEKQEEKKAKLQELEENKKRGKLKSR